MPPRRAGHPATSPIERMRFRRAPLLAAAVAFALGIGLAQVAQQPAAVLVAALGLLAVLALVALRFGLRAAVWPVLGVWATMGMAAALWQPSPVQPVRLQGLADGLSRTVRGRVVQVRVPSVEPVANGHDDADSVPPWEASEDVSAQHGRPLSLDLEVDDIEDVTPDTSAMVGAPGGVRVSVYPAVGASSVSATYACGDEVEVPLRLRVPQRFRDPGVFQSADWLLGQGIAAQASVSADRVTRLGTAPPTVACRLRAAQAWASGRMLEFAGSSENERLPRLFRLSAADALMLNAMLFGDRTGLTHTLRAGFERTGTFHLFVVSGLHIALLAAGVFWAMGRLRAPAWLATTVTLVAAAGYTALTGFGQPAQRALVMTAVYLLARLLRRDADPLNALGAAVLALLVWSPRSLFDASLQMTVLAIVAIGGIAVPLGRRTFLRYARVTHYVFRTRRSLLSPEEAQLRLMLEVWGEAVADVLGRRTRRLPAMLVRAVLWAGELALIGLVAELVMVLPMAVYFHRAAVFALPANMVVIPLIALLAPAGVLTFAGSLVSPWLALVPGAAAALLLHGVRFAIGHASHVQAADVRVPGPVWWVGLLAVAGWGACCWAVRRSGWAAAGAAIALPLIAVAVLWPERAEVVAGALEVTAIDVGQGDSLLLVSPEGRTMLVDAGGPVGSHGVSEVVSNFDVGEEVVSPYLWTRRLRRLDVLVLTHAHTDHMGGMPSVLENFRPRELWVGAAEPRSPLYAALLDKAAELGVRVRHLHAGERAALGSVEVEALAPASDYSNAAAPKNDDSLVLHLQFGRASVLLEGDAERPSEDAMLAAGLVHPVTLLKVGHHGSRTSSNPEFLSAVAPCDAVISVGRHNTFGHPRGEVIERFAAAGTHVFRTDEFGLTTFLLARDGAIDELVEGTKVPEQERIERITDGVAGTLGGALCKPFVQ